MDLWLAAALIIAAGKAIYAVVFWSSDEDLTVHPNYSEKSEKSLLQVNTGYQHEIECSESKQDSKAA